MPFTYDYAHSALTVDAVVFGLDKSLKVLLIKRGLDPYAGSWALPGGFVKLEETLEEAVRRSLEEETGMRDIFLEQLYTFGSVERDPRERVVSVAYTALVKPETHRLHAAADITDARWFSMKDLPELAFDHSHILQVAQERLKGKLRYQPVGFELLPPSFSLTQLQTMYEIIFERSLDKRNFRKKILKMNLLQDTGKMEEGVARRPAKLYRFDKAKYDQLKESGFNFEV